jgi:hypothetical protein
MKTTRRSFTPRNASEPRRRAGRTDDLLTRQIAARTLHTRWA